MPREKPGHAPDEAKRTIDFRPGDEPGHALLTVGEARHRLTLAEAIRLCDRLRGAIPELVGRVGPAGDMRKGDGTTDGLWGGTGDAG